MDSSASIPDMEPDAARRRREGVRSYDDTNHLIAPEDVTRVFNYQRDPSEFTLTEQLRFALAYKDTPAEFDKIVELLPGRTREECIHHYYEHKFDGRFKTESRRQRYDRLPVLVIEKVKKYPPLSEMNIDSLPELDIRLRGRSKSQVRAAPVGTEEERFHNSGRPMRRRASLPQYNEGPTDDDLLLVVPIDIHIAELQKKLRLGKPKYFEKTKPKMKSFVVLPLPFALDRLSDNFQHPCRLTDLELMRWLRSGSVLPLVKEWFRAVIHNGKLYQELKSLLSQEGTKDLYPEQVADIAHLAQEYKLHHPGNLGFMHQDVLLVCAQFAYKIGRASRDYFSQLGKPYGNSDREVCLDGANVLLFAVEDFMRNRNGGFFRVLLESKLAKMVKPSVRRDWERLYPVEGEVLTLTFRTKEDWEKVFEYEGEEGRAKDWDESEEAKVMPYDRIPGA